MTEFFQTGPSVSNSYLSDSLLRHYLERTLPKEMFAEIAPGLERLGARATTDLLEISREAERVKPELVNFEPWGRRIDDIRVSPAWAKLDQASAEEGIVATGFERKHGALSRVHQFARLYLFHPASAYYTCPLAMTDGAARAIELYGDDELKKNAYRHLTSRNPREFWTSGQWMTERTGGSDVGTSETVAKKEGDQYRLYGTKWFTSATTSQMVMTLARIEGAPEGSKGLSLFYLEMRNPNGSLNGMKVNRLKDKLGTSALPTAEVELVGARARLVGGEGGGVRKISSLFNITRMYNACVAASSMRRAIDLARDYSEKRKAFGKLISDHPLHLETLAQLEVEQIAGFLMTFRLIELLGKDETGTATPEESAILRLLTPIAKLFTGKQATAVTSEVLECFGGAGYVEDTGIPRLLRDAQVLSIWEGTTNVLSLDMLRAMEKENALEPFLKEVAARLEKVTHPELKPAVDQARSALARIQAYVPKGVQGGVDFQQAGARQLAFFLARVFSASLMLEHAEWTVKSKTDRRALHAAIRWCWMLDRFVLPEPDPRHRDASRALALG